MPSKKHIEQIKKFWDERAILGEKAGTRDLIAKKLEMNAIIELFHDGMKVLDAGCGNGITAIALAERYKVDVTGFDFSPEMIEQAQKALEGRPLSARVKFLTGDILNMPQFPSAFDAVYTERTLINLPDWESQKLAISNMADALDEGGMYVMCECSQAGLDNINKFRVAAGLPEITAAWHNRYMKDEELKTVTCLKLEKVVNFSSTYYFLSRVVNACLAAKEGREPEYDSPLNQMALFLPSMGGLGQNRIWLWRKE